MSLFENYFGNWVRVMDGIELNKVVQKINSIDRNNLCPSYHNIFKSFNLCKYEDLKVVMLGQDPYPQKGVATGILFGNEGESNISPSLQIVKESCINFEIPHNSIIFDHSLEDWAKQGVLMLNSALTVEVGKVGSHSMLWRPFISSLFKNLSEVNNGIIYVLFGEQAKTFKPYINSKFNTIIEERHPAYYARIQEKMPSTVFETVTRLTKEKYGEPIVWFNSF